MASILVVDDELNVRQLVRRILERAGHKVSEARIVPLQKEAQELTAIFFSSRKTARANR